MAIANGILIAADSFCRVIDAAIALCHLESPLASLLLVLGLCPGIGFLVFGSSIEVFADGIEAVALLDMRLRRAGRQQAKGNSQYPIYAVLHFFLFTLYYITYRGGILLWRGSNCRKNMTKG